MMDGYMVQENFSDLHNDYMGKNRNVCKIKYQME
jgi:hypothetical protein